MWGPGAEVAEGRFERGLGGIGKEPFLTEEIGQRHRAQAEAGVGQEAATVEGVAGPAVRMPILEVVAGIGGIVVLETLFAIPGMGQLLVAQALPKRDYPLIQGIVLVMALITATVNLCVDLTYGFLDPRVRF